MKPRSLDVSDIKAPWIRAELDTDEEVVWSGEPKPRAFTPEARGMFLFAIPWTAFSIFWIGGASLGMREDMNLFTCAFPAFGLPFVLIGFGMLSAPYFQRRTLERTAYVVTNRRVLVIDHDYRDRRSVRSYGASDLTPITKTVFEDETADLMFAVSTSGTGSDATTKDIGFHGVRDVRGAEQAIRALVGQGAVVA